MSYGWAVELNGVLLSGGDAVGEGCLTLPPDGLGLPSIRTEDVTYPQRDGVRHFADWYEPRIITLQNVQVCPDGCATCPGARQKVRNILQAWSRQCDDIELVVFTDCHDPNATDEERSYNGPFGIVGRPRVAGVTWRQGKNGCAIIPALRFDATDHRMFVLDGDGTPGSGVVQVQVNPTTSSRCRVYPRCYPMCYDQESGEAEPSVITTVTGTECADLIVCFNGQLTDPVLENVTTGEQIGITGVIAAGAEPICVDTENGTATQGGASRTHLITGNPRFRLQPGENELRLTSFSSTDTGFVTVEYRNAVVSA